MPRPFLLLVALAAALFLPAAASAYPPVVSLSSVAASGSTTAVVQTQISPRGEDTTYYVAYDLLTSQWCSTGGTGVPTYTTAPVDYGSVDTGQFLAIPLSGLMSDVQYCADIYATNADGTTDSGQMTWWQSAPTVDTTALTVTGYTTATIQGQINPDHQVTSYFARYAPASSEWCTTSGASGNDFYVAYGSSLGSSDDTFHDVSVQIYGLTSGTGYCAALVSSSGYQEWISGGQLAWTQSWPTAKTWDAYSTTTSDAVVEGEVNAADDATTTYQVQYARADASWCTTGATSGSPTTTTATSSGLDLTSTSLQYVAVDVSGLTEGVDYCARLIATNDEGESDGQQVWWTQGLPTTDTYTGDSSSTTTATVTGEVDPAGQATTYQVDYDLAGSNWCQTGEGSASYSTTSEATPGTDGNTFYPVTVDLTGLTPGDDYCADVVATNADGTYESFPVYWTQPTPPPPPPALTVRVLGSGKVTSSPSGIDCGAGATECSASFAPGTQVTLTESPVAGATFLNWGFGPNCSSATASTCTLRVSSDLTIDAVFSPATMGFVSVQITGGPGTVTSSPAGIDCTATDATGTSCRAAFAAGTQVTLTATPDTSVDSAFDGWSGGLCSGTGTCTINVSQTGTAVEIATFDASVLPTCALEPSPKVALHGKAAGKLTLSLQCDQDVEYTIDGTVTEKWTTVTKRRVKVKGKQRIVRRKKTHTATWSFAELTGQVKAAAATTLTVQLPKGALARLRHHAAASAEFDMNFDNTYGANGLSVRVKRLT